jgi:hypothetical protein
MVEIAQQEGLLQAVQDMVASTREVLVVLTVLSSTRYHN